MGYLGTKPQTATQLADNIVTSDKIQAGAVGTTDIADGAVTGTKLENSGVTAGTYGSASAIPAVTVDAKGRVTSVTTNAFSAAPTTAQVLAATAGATAGAVGTYAFLYQSSDTGNIAFGGTKAGNLLVAAISPGGPQTSSAVSGTWRCMGHTNTSLYSTSYTTVWLRIS